MGIVFELGLALIVVGLAVYQVVATRRLLREREELEARKLREAAEADGAERDA